MPTIRPFRALRYNQNVAGNISELVAPPYDIIYDEWCERLYNRNPHNIIRLIKTKEEPGDAGGMKKYEKANDYIETWMKKGARKLDDKPSIYVRSIPRCSPGWIRRPRPCARLRLVVKVLSLRSGIY